MKLISILSVVLGLSACGGSAASTPANTPATASSSIIATARAAGSFTTLLAALDAAGLTSTLEGPGPFTVFAPTDAAFAALPAGTVENLLLPENRAQLTAVLTYHVVSGDVRAAQVVTMTSATSLQGSAIQIATEGGNVRLNGSATVATADVAASNGVIHVIDQVILPPS